MPAAAHLRTDFTTGELPRLAPKTRQANQSRRFLSLAAVRDRMSRTDAARIGGMERRTLRGWVYRSNEIGPDRLRDERSKGHPPRLTLDQLAELSALVEAGPD